MCKNGIRKTLVRESGILKKFSPGVRDLQKVIKNHCSDLLLFSSFGTFTYIYI